MCWTEYQQFLGSRPTARTLSYTGKAVLHHFGHLQPNHIEKSHCDEYCTKRYKGGISTGSVHTELGHLRSALKYAEKIDLIDRVPHIWRPAKPAPKERFLTRDEIGRLIEGANAHHIRLAVALLLGTAGGIGAILDLEWSRVDFERGTINLRLTDSQNRKGRAVVPMNGMTRAALQTARVAALTEYVVEYACGRVKSI